MSPLQRSSLLAQHARAGRLDIDRVGVRTAVRPGPSGSSAPDSAIEFATWDPGEASRRIGPLAVTLETRPLGEFGQFATRIRNHAAAPVQVESVVVGLRWRDHALSNLRYLRHGWQSWSFTGVGALGDSGDGAFPSGEWLRGMHHAVGSPGAERRGWYESDGVTVVGEASGGPSCLVGALERGRAFAVVYLQHDRGGGEVAIEVEQRLEVVLEPGEERELELVHAGLDLDASPLLERFATRWGREAGARTQAPFSAGWCSWYHFFHEVTEEDVLRNLDALVKARTSSPAIPIDVVQLDDGYQHAVGDWLETNEKFPRGLAALASDIRDAGFRAGLWTAPFCVVPRSRLFAAHPEWLLRNGDAHFLGLVHGEWSPQAGSPVHALDTTQPQVRAHLSSVFAELVDMGWSYLKLDFLHVAAMRADAHDLRVTRAARLHRGLEAIRSGAGDAAFLLGCGSPMGPAVGIVDAMRIGPDVAPHWDVDPRSAIPGIEAALPSLRSALRSVGLRAWMHRRLWINDPDCLMVRAGDTALGGHEVRSLAANVGATGGLAVFSDDLPGLDGESRSLLAETIALGRAVDEARRAGAARLQPLLADGAVLAAQCGRDEIRLQTNSSDEPVENTLLLRGAAPQGRALLSTAQEPMIAAHASALVSLPESLDLAVFCDFDGTFSVQDVGSTLAQLHLGERRMELWARYERGGISAWDYNVELFTGFELPEEELEAFLRTVELDPGARDLLAWCEANDIPFRILSDGFDHNLDALQRIHDLRFAYSANALRYEVDSGEAGAGRDREGAGGKPGWRIAPGHLDRDCGCGTGTCKRGLIDEYREQHPRALCVHVGNGRVSDLCGALAADLVFAKESLAEALDERGCDYERFDTLLDVRRDLVAWMEGRLGADRAGSRHAQRP